MYIYTEREIDITFFFYKGVQILRQYLSVKEMESGSADYMGCFQITQVKRRFFHVFSIILMCSLLSLHFSTFYVCTTGF